MNYPLPFQKLIDDCQKENQYVGLGNAAAKMLFVGKEAGIDRTASNPHGWASNWLEEKVDYSKRYIPDNKAMLKRGHTWQRYQMLYELIMANLSRKVEKGHDYEITFVEDVFTTELSNLHASRSNEAKQQAAFADELKKRKEVFWKSPFVAQFPIVLIFALDNSYIETYGGEVQQLFNVKFIEKRPIGKTNMYIHREAEGSASPKLLIHTRQLTNGAPNALIYALADEVAGFVKENPSYSI